MIYQALEYEDVIAEEGRLNERIFSLKRLNIRKGIVFDGSQVLGKLRPYLLIG